ncbi:MAG: LTA synthase family protein [Lachnospiraceae bacterium]|nr:LTA synthase family protein [Lachnospiraceae bacterium]
MNKRTLIWKSISRILLLIVFFVVIIVLRSANWFLQNFNEVEFSVALYQLLSPLKGTEAGVLSDYINECLYPSFYFSVICVIVYTIYDMMAGKLFLEMAVQIGAKKICIRGKKSRFTNARKVIVLWSVIAILSVCVWNRAVAVGIPEYVESVTNVSHIFEEEYVDPDAVSIIFPEKKRNLIVIYMESMETTYASTQDGGGKAVNYIPELTDLARENVSFSNGDDLGGAGGVAETGWTMGGLFASATGVPYKLPIGENSAGEYENFAPGLKGLGEILKENGYNNYFMCGSDAGFGGRLAFYRQHGGYEVLDHYTAKQSGIIPENYRVFWGMEDEKLYEYAKQELLEIAKYEEPFNFMMLTVDTHMPDGYMCSLCDDMYPDQYENVLACASRQLSQFIDWLTDQDWYENTTIVITGDHLSMKADFWDDIFDYQRKIYNCFINLPEGLWAEQTTNREFSVLDMFPTILASIGADIEGDRLGLGTNLFSEQQTLPEQMGFEEFNKELRLYSNYYYMNFIVGNRTHTGELIR